MERDLISNLPKIILHDILSRLPEKDAARTSVLSKAWAETWFTFPNLSFCDTRIIGTFPLPQPYNDFLRKRKNFIDHVKRTLLRFHDQGLAINEFKLSINCFELQYMSQDVDHWINLASKSGVRKLELVLPCGLDQDEEGLTRCYILPTGIVEAKSLYNLVLKGGIRVDHAFLNHSVCRNLRRLRLLSLKGTTITDKWLLDLFRKFPFLQDLGFYHCTMSETINISSNQLKFLEITLSPSSNLKVVNINAPNLLLCAYFGLLEAIKSKPIISFLRSSSQLKVYVYIPSYFVDLGNLREFIQNFKPQNVLTSLSIIVLQPVVDELNLDVLPVLSNPPNIRNLDLLCVPKIRTLYRPLVNILLSSCRPATISLPRECSREFIEIFSELLKSRQDECFCSSGHTKCWWHDLKDFKVSFPTKTETDKNITIKFKTILDKLASHLSEGKIRFTFEF